MQRFLILWFTQVLAVLYLVSCEGGQEVVQRTASEQYPAAAECVFPQHPLRALEASEAVFVGLVLDVGEVAVSGPEDSVFGITVQMLQSWKGPTADTVTMLGSASSTDYEFEVGTTYLIYARYVRPELKYLSTAYCMPTRPIEEAEDHILALGRPRWPEHCFAIRVVRGRRVCYRR
jgi:hypothetical protein